MRSLGCFERCEWPDLNLCSRDVTTTVTMEGEDKLITVQVPKKAGQKKVEVVREFTAEGIKVTMKADTVTSTQFFKRQ